MGSVPEASGDSTLPTPHINPSNFWPFRAFYSSLVRERKTAEHIRRMNHLEIEVGVPCGSLLLLDKL